VCEARLSTGNIWSVLMYVYKITGKGTECVCISRLNYWEIHMTRREVWRNRENAVRENSLFHLSWSGLLPHYWSTNLESLCESKIGAAFIQTPSPGVGVISTCCVNRQKPQFLSIYLIVMK